MIEDTEERSMRAKATRIASMVDDFVAQALAVRNQHAQRLDALSRQVSALESELSQVGWQMKAAIENERIAREEIDRLRDLLAAKDQK